MSGSRGDFLAALGLAGASRLAVSDPSPLPTSGPGATPSAPASSNAEDKPPSEAAMATARAMRRFDAALSDAEILTIAKGIDGAASFAHDRLEPKGAKLQNSDEPVTTFRVRE